MDGFSFLVGCLLGWAFWGGRWGVVFGLGVGMLWGVVFECAVLMIGRNFGRMVF